MNFLFIGSFREPFVCYVLIWVSCVCILSQTLDGVKRKILVLDLDETLIHSHHDGVLRPTVRPGTPPDFILKVRAFLDTHAGIKALYISAFVLLHAGCYR